ncbi:MAG: hypothetical protein ACK2T0_12140 [Anaerolineales bacterium]
MTLQTALQPEQQKEHEYLYWEFHENPTTEQAVRMGTWKAVRHAPSGAIELYDLRQDIGEENNVATEHADIVNRVKDYLDKSPEVAAGEVDAVLAPENAAVPEKIEE